MQYNPLPDEEGVPTKEARLHFSELLGRAHHAKERIRLTKNGKTVAYLVPPEDVELLKEREREQLLSEIYEGFQQIDNGDYLTAEQLQEHLSQHRATTKRELEEKRKKSNG